MTQRYHINKKGEPAVCSAAAGNCPLGGDHYDSKPEAAQAYEKEMHHKLLPTGIASDATMSQLNELAKFTQDPEVVVRAAVEGSERTFKNLAKNQWADGAMLLQAHGTAKNEDTKLALVTNPNFPVASMSGKEFVHALSQKNLSTKESDRLLTSNEINNEHLAALLEDNHRTGLQYRVSKVLSNPNNGISEAGRVAAAEKSWITMGYAQKSGKYPADRIPGLNEDLVYWGNVYKESNPAYLAAYGEWAVNNGGDKASNIASHVANNEATPRETLDKLGEAGLAEQAVFAHRNTSSATRDAIIRRNPDVASQAKINALNVAHRGNLRAEVTKTDTTSHPSGVNRGLADTVVQFDTDKLKDLGLDDRDVFTLMGGRGRFNGGSSYDSATGVFRGTVDTTD